MIAGHDELRSLLQVWRNDQSHLHVEIRRRDADCAFDAVVVDVTPEAVRFSARAGGLVVTLSLLPDFDIRYDDVPPAREHRHVYDRGLVLVYPFTGDPHDAERIVIVEIKETQIQP